VNSSSLSKWIPRLFWIVPLTFYFSTACRWPGWIDAPMIAGNTYRVVLGTWVNTHNLFNLLGHVWAFLIPIGEYHARLNFFCAFLGAVTVTLVFLAGLKITRNLLAASVGAIAVMLGHSLWWFSTMLKVYTLSMALMAGFLYLIVSYDEEGDNRRLYAAFFLFGMACSNHVMMGLFVFAFAALLIAAALRPDRGIGAKAFAWAGLAFILGFSLFEGIFLQEFVHRFSALPAHKLRSAWSLVRDMVDGATGGHFRRFMFPKFLSPEQKWHWRENYLFLLFMNYPSVAFAAGWVGLVAFARNQKYRLTFIFFAVGIVAQAIWSSNYMIWDMYGFGMPVWVLFGFAGVLGFDALFRSRAKVIALCLLPTLLVGPILYARIPVWAQTAGFWKEYFSFFDYVSNLWDPATYLANPNKRHYDDVARIADAVFTKVPTGAHVYDDDGKGDYPIHLYYQNVLNRRPDIHFHSIFGPTLDDRSAAATAQEMAANLDRGESVYISSPYWPERPVLDQLYALLAKEASPDARPGLPQRGDGLPVERLEQTFPKYEMRRIPLIEGKPFFIYQFVKR
jgi:transmembrane protein TMEM260 (protein O-mannosyltransferase)